MSKKLSTGSTKPRYGLIPTRALRLVARIFTGGADKHGINDWRETNYPYSYHYDAIQRHLNDFWGGLDIDEESGEHPLAHVATRAMMLLDTIKARRGVDDRWRE